MRILDRYIWKELWTPFLLGLFVSTFLLLVDRIFDLMDLIINKGVPVALVGLLFLYLLPAILVLTIPIGVLFSILVAFGRLSADMEIVAMKACGVSPLRLLWPVMSFGLAMAAATGYLMIDSVPKTNYAFKSLVFDIVRTQASVGVKERIFNDTFGNFVIYVDEIAPDQVALRNVFVSDERKPEEQRFITAREGRLLSDEVNRRVTLRLLDGSIHETSPSALQKYREVRFRLYDITLVLENPLVKQGGAPKGDREMSLTDLRKTVQEFTAGQGQSEPLPGGDTQEVRDPGRLPGLQRAGGAAGHPGASGRPLGRVRGGAADPALLLRRADPRRERRRHGTGPALARDVGAEPPGERGGHLPAPRHAAGAPDSARDADPAVVLDPGRAERAHLAAHHRAVGTVAAAARRRRGGGPAPGGRRAATPSTSSTGI